jgi:hypothetical protein
MLAVLLLIFGSKYVSIVKRTLNPPYVSIVKELCPVLRQVFRIAYHIEIA